MKKILLMLVLSLVLVGCGNEVEPVEESVESILNEEEEREITEWIDNSTMYEKAKLEADDETITIWIDLKGEAVDSAKDYANGLANRVAKLYDYEVTVQVTAMQKIEGSEKVRAFGNSLFTPESGKVSYEAY